MTESKTESTTHEYGNMTILERVQQVKASVIYIQQNKPGDMRYWVNSYDKVLERIRPLHIKYGICVTAEVVRQEHQDKVDRKTGLINGYIAHMAVKYRLYAVPPIPKDDYSPILETMVAASFSDLEGMATSKVFTHCHLKFLIDFYEILTGSEDEDKKLGDLSARTDPAPVTYITAAQAAELKRVAGLVGVDDAVVARAGGADSVEAITAEQFASVFDRIKKKAQQLGKWSES